MRGQHIKRTSTGLSLADTDLQQLFKIKYGELQSTGWGPRRRHKFDYYQPADYYEAVVTRVVSPETRWIDVGGGGDIFPENRALARELSGRAQRLVGVDPSDNIETHDILHDHAKVMIEDFDTDERFDLATLRMVAEHIADPPAVAKALSRLLLPGGRVIIFTVNRWSPITLISQAVPFSLHYPIKKFFWGGEEEDTFPVEYKMNTRKALQNLFAENGFVEESFAYLDDLSVFGHFKLMGYVELSLWRLINKLGLRYPENCLLGVYKKQ